MSGQCCVRGAASGRLSRWIITATASLLPGAAMVLVPKCPMCLAAWLTVATGIAVSEGGVAYMRGLVVLVSVAAAATAVALLRRPRAAHPSFTMYGGRQTARCFNRFRATVADHDCAKALDDELATIPRGHQT